eukprot:2305182-Pyramimonas_sp.AAC.1
MGQMPFMRSSDRRAHSPIMFGSIPYFTQRSARLCARNSRGFSTACAVSYATVPNESAKQEHRIQARRVFRGRGRTVTLLEELRCSVQIGTRE